MTHCHCTPLRISLLKHNLLYSPSVSIDFCTVLSLLRPGLTKVVEYKADFHEIYNTPIDDHKVELTAL